MSKDNIELVRQTVEAFNDGGIAGALRFLDASAVFEEPPEQPGPEVARGRDSFGETFARFDANWEAHRSETQEIRAIDDERVLRLSLEHFRGRDGIEVSQPAGTIFTVRDRKIVRMQPFWDQQRAIEAAAAPG